MDVFAAMRRVPQVLSYAFQGTSRNGSTRPAKNGFHRASLYTAVEHDLTVVFGDLNSRLADLPDDGFPKGPASHDTDVSSEQTNFALRTTRGMAAA